MPVYAHGPDEDAGLDLKALADVELVPGLAALVPTGLAIAPVPGYRGEIRVILLNLGRELYQVKKGDRIAQMVIARYEAVEWEEVDLDETRRGAGGFGSSGR